MEKITGIYMIRNMITDEKYIGQFRDYNISKKEAILKAKKNHLLRRAICILIMIINKY